MPSGVEFHRWWSLAFDNIEWLVASFSALPKVDPQVMRLFQQRVYGHLSNSDNKNSTVAVGPLIVDSTGNILLVKTHKWGGRYSIPGERPHPGEKIEEALVRAVREQTGLTAIVGRDICVFNELPESGYFRPDTARIFIDKIVHVSTTAVSLDHRAQDYVWISPDYVLRDLDIEPNARKTLVNYQELFC